MKRKLLVGIGFAAIVVAIGVWLGLPRLLVGIGLHKQIEELGITFTPMHPERDLRAAGARFEGESRFRGMFANHVVVDGRLVTGQNQNSGAETAHRMMEALLRSSR